eukprot:CAMPEP_0169427570 /NCGR_PEP_ID=MMETSP1042-20121227/848_1 /TAXON_ID=464988 /ORGANISM="Hemiselmis andersenii, Strain CCMP1180" /LENGTH=454 /DNA_ID=CAMNT_0009537651 /DNA_START=49 /DNA_END=1409 /DNA_ORIENTATION=+
MGTPLADAMQPIITQVTPLINLMDRAQWGFSFFDAGSWAYSSVTSSTLAPIIFVHRLHEQMHGGKSHSIAGLKPSSASSLWVFMIALSTLCSGILCPLLGALVDRYHLRKVTTYSMSALSVVFMTMFAFTTKETDWREVLVLVGLAIMFMSTSHCFYNSLLVLVTESVDLIKVACLQSAVGGFAAAILLTWLGVADEENAELTRPYVISCFLYAALWFVAFSVPMWLWLDESPPDSDDESSVFDSLALTWRSTLSTMRNTEMMKYLLAMMLFNDAASTLHAVYLVYAATIGIPTHQLLLGAVAYRCSGLASLAWLGMAAFMGPKMMMMACILLTAASIVFCAWMQTAVHFYLVIVTMTVSHSGSYIFSRVLMATITPMEKASHNFGFMGMINRFAGFLGPFLFSTLSVALDERTGFLGLVFLALLGMVVFGMVDFERGREMNEVEMLEDRQARA